MSHGAFSLIFYSYQLSVAAGASSSAKSSLTSGVSSCAGSFFATGFSSSIKLSFISPARIFSSKGLAPIRRVRSSLKITSFFAPFFFVIFFVKHTTEDEVEKPDFSPSKLCLYLLFWFQLKMFQDLDMILK